MKVAVLTKHFPTSRQPWAGQSVYQTLRLLAQKCELEVFYPEAVYPKLLEPQSAKGEALDRRWNPAGVKTTYVPHIVLPVVSRALNGAVITRKLLPYLRAFAPDVVLSYFIYPDGYAAVKIAQKLGVPVVVTAVGSDINRIADAMCRRLTSTTLREADVVTTVSADLARKAIAMGADPARTSPKPNGSDAAIFYPRDRAESRRELGLSMEEEAVVYVGRLDYRKGLVELVEAAATLKDKRPLMRTYLVGGGPDEGMLREAIAKHHVQDRVALVPACPTQQVGVWMGASNLVTLPSYNEGCPNVVVEALSSGRPVVATNVGGVPELMGEDAGAMIPVQDVPALAAALDAVLSKTWSAEEISRSRSRSWQDVADDTMQLLTNAVAQKSQAR